MRLTLRTLLAFLDGVLDRQDAKDLHEKVAQGRLAMAMVERIQSVIKRPKLTAPKVDARGTAGDANVVAEYLDNTMQAMHVAEFEQACLAEDARLAEVASCHQILTIVLAKPAEVSPELRERVRRLGSTESYRAGELNPQEKRGAAALESLRDSVIERNGKRFRIDQNHRASATTNEETRAAPERAIVATGLELDDKLINHVPEYLKSGNSGYWSNILPILGLLAALIFVAWLSLGSLENVQGLLYQNTKIERPSLDAPPVQQQVQQQVQQPNAPAAPIVEANSTPPGPVVESAAPPMARDAIGTPDSEAKMTEAPVIVTENVAPPTGTPPVVAPPTGESSDPPPPTGEPVVAPPPASATPESTSKAWLQWQPETKESKRAVVFAKRESQGSAPSIRQLTNGEALAREDQLVVPPAFRTEFLLAPGIRWTASDESVLESIASDTVDSAAVHLRIGRALVHATPDCQNVALKTPIDLLAIRMKDASSIVAIELRYKRVAGRTIEQTLESLSTSPEGMMQPMLSLVCVAGEATIVRRNEEPLMLEVGQGFAWAMDAPVRPVAIKEIPWWYRTSFQRPIDAEAAQDLSDRMSDQASDQANEKAKTPLELLETAIDSRRSETAALALRAMFLLGEYDKCFGSDAILANPASRPHRAAVLDSFYQSLGTDVHNEANVKEAIEATDLPRSARLIGLLGLPDDSQLSDGQDRVLVESLGSPFIDERVLAIYQLNAILGKEHGFQSDRPSADSIQQWKRLLNSAKIRWPK